jgi:mono/diheme cytochrome c family protein
MNPPRIALLLNKLSGWVAVLLASQILLGCNYARMTKDEAIHTYEIRQPVMPEGTMPISGGYALLRQTKPEKLVNPIAHNLKTVRAGQVRYNWYCIQCHGPNADGNGTVGQSFVPLPFALRSPGVQSKSDGEIFRFVMFGHKKMPPLITTVTDKEAWCIINYIRWLGKEFKG